MSVYRALASLPGSDRRLGGGGGGEAPSWANQRRYADDIFGYQPRLVRGIGGQQRDVGPGGAAHDDHPPGVDPVLRRVRLDPRHRAVDVADHAGDVRLRAAAVRGVHDDMAWPASWRNSGRVRTSLSKKCQEPP